METNTYAIYYRHPDGSLDEEHYVAVCIEAALGLFFMDHPSLSYNNIREHLAV